MSARIAIGVGCRLGSSANAIEALVRHALDRAPPAERLGIFTIEDKNTEPGLIAAARRLGLDLVFLTRDALREQAPFVQTRSIASGTPVRRSVRRRGRGAGRRRHRRGADFPADRQPGRDLRDRPIAG